jgi:hypothetical protein
LIRLDDLTKNPLLLDYFLIIFIRCKFILVLCSITTLTKVLRLLLIDPFVTSVLAKQVRRKMSTPQWLGGVFVTIPTRLPTLDKIILDAQAQFARQGALAVVKFSLVKTKICMLTLIKIDVNSISLPFK